MSSPLPIAPGSPWLAPLAGFSDLAFRLLCRERGAAVAVTEMVSAKGLVYGSPGTEPLLATCPEDCPLVVQLFGAEPETVARAMDLLLARGFTHFDLNAGCSVPKVVKTGAGAALLNDPARLVCVVAAMVRAVGPGRVGVKLRLGWCAGRECHLDLGRALEDAGVAWLTLHPRTARQAFSGRADWPEIAALVSRVSIPVMASGDLFTAEDAAACLKESGASGVMFARGAMADPAVFSRLQALLDGQVLPPATPAELAALVSRHAELIRRFDFPRRGFLRLRTIVPRYLRGLPGAKAVREALIRAADWSELPGIIERIAAARSEESC